MDNLKGKMHEINKHRYIHEGDIWWYAADENISTEINGKSKHFSRPVLILKKYWHYSFRGVPMASQEHKGNWHAELMFREKESAAIIQLRNLDVARLYDRIVHISKSDLDKVKNRVIELLLKRSE